MKLSVIFIACVLLARSSPAQEYKIKAAASDSFANALINTLRCAANRFADCKGDSLRNTWLGGIDYRLNFHFPNSVAEVVTGRDYDKNVYVEFRGYRNKQERDAGILALVAKIKAALGEQVYDAHVEDKSANPLYFYMLSLKDNNGYFSPNMELFGGTTDAPVYLLKDETAKPTSVENHFVLLKIQGGIPNYQYYIRHTAPSNQSRSATIQLLHRAARTDFDSLQKARPLTSWRKRKSDTLTINGWTSLMNYRGGNYFAQIHIPAATDSAALNQQWLQVQQDLQSALGTNYVYNIGNWGEGPYIVYYDRGGGEQQPSVYLRREKQGDQTTFINIEIRSTVSRPTNAGLQAEDFED